jgi:hypothetical protein
MLILLVYYSSEQNLTRILNFFTRLFKSKVGFPNIGFNATLNPNLKISAALTTLASMLNTV